MNIILLERIEKLGQLGDIVKVKLGFARNYLLPQKKALRATKENQANFEMRRAHLETQSLERREEAQVIANKLSGFSVEIIRQAGESGMLYGSVRSNDIVNAIKESGFVINRHQVILDHPIKSLGVSQVRISLHPEVIVTIKINVSRSQKSTELTINTEQLIKKTEDIEEFKTTIQEDITEIN
jgi:large subunit ribosomal protein L9